MKQSITTCKSHNWIFLFQDHGITGLSEVYSTRQSVSPVSTNRKTSPILTQLQQIPDCSPGFKPTYKDQKHEFMNMCLIGCPKVYLKKKNTVCLNICNDLMHVCVCGICLRLAVVLHSQVHISSLGRESSGSPILITENVTSATTHVTKVELLSWT